MYSLWNVYTPWLMDSQVAPSRLAHRADISRYPASCSNDSAFSSRACSRPRRAGGGESDPGALELGGLAARAPPQGGASSRRPDVTERDRSPVRFGGA